MRKLRVMYVRTPFQALAGMPARVFVSYGHNRHDGWVFNHYRVAENFWHYGPRHMSNRGFYA